MFGRTNYQATVGRNAIPGKTKTLIEAATAMQARGLFGVGGVILDRTEQSTRWNGEKYYDSASWDDMANLRDNYGWHFVSQSKSYTSFTLLTTDHDRYVESGQTLITLEGKGHMNAWGCFNFPTGPQGPAAGPAVVNQYFAGSRQYCQLTQWNTQASLNNASHDIYAHSAHGGRANDPASPGYSIPIFHPTTGAPDYCESPAELAAYLSPPPGQWHILQFYRFVDGANGAVAKGTPNWDTGSADWKKRWTGQQELFPWKTFIEALDMRTTDAKCVHPAEMAELWGRIPLHPHGVPGL